MDLDAWLRFDFAHCEHDLIADALAEGTEPESMEERNFRKRLPRCRSEEPAGDFPRPRPGDFDGGNGPGPRRRED
jgi:hypothetical protein